MPASSVPQTTRPAWSLRAAASRRSAIVACAGGVVVLACAWAFAQGVVGRRALQPAGGLPLWIADSALEDGRRLLLIVDSATRHAAVYHVDAATGTLTLRSTRDLSWDLVFEDFNAQEPKPAALRRMLETGGTGPGPVPAIR